MIDLSIFNEDELEYIVSIIPRARAINYLQRNSKEFSKIKPGFRVNALPDNQLFPLLYKELQKGNDFIVTFVVGFLKSSLQEIADAYQEECQKRDETTALIYTLNYCYFRSRLNVYFKLVDKEISQAEIDKIVAAMDILQEGIEQQRLMESDLAKKDQQILSLEKDINELVDEKKRWVQEKEAIVSKNEELQAEMATSLERYNGLQEDIAKYSEQNKELQKILDELKSSLLHKESEIQGITSEKESLSDQLTEQIERNREHLQKIEELELMLAEQKALPLQHSTNENIWSIPPEANKCYMPEDMEECRDLISYYLEDSGVTDGGELLISYISRIAFSGKPIVGKRQDCQFLVNCLSRILTNGKSLTLNFSDGVNLNDISNALNSDCRIVYLDNFIGNFNETVLYSLLEKYRNKIVVISAMFDRTFNYIGIEFLSLSHYFNVSRLKYKMDIDFDSASLEEKAYIPTTEILQNSPTASLKSILKELNFPKSIRENLIISIETHDESFGILAFCAIPYMIDVSGINPFDSAEKLNAYCDKNRNRHLIYKWFTHE